MTAKSTLTNRIAVTAAITIGAGAVALGAAIATTPIANAATFQQICTNDPGAYATGAVRGVYSTQKVGFDRYEICKVYDSADKLMGTFNLPHYNFYKVGVPNVPALPARI